MNDLISGVRVKGTIQLEGKDIYAPGTDVCAVRDPGADPAPSAIAIGAVPRPSPIRAAVPSAAVQRVRCGGRMIFPFLIVRGVVKMARLGVDPVGAVPVQEDGRRGR